MTLRNATRNFVLSAIAAFCFAAPGSATTITVLYSDSDPAVAQVDYTFRTTGNGGINHGQTQFNPLSGTAEATGTADYVYAIPVGAVVSDATLDLFGAFDSNHDLEFTGTGAFLPVFSSTPGAVAVTITAGGTSTTVSGNGTYNLLPLFLNAITTGTPIHVSYALTDQFAADLSLYLDGSLKNEDDHFTVTDTFQFTTQGGLNITYSQQAPAPAPEPGSLVMAGVGMVLVLAGKLRKS
jgi:hypothetical protein